MSKHDPNNLCGVRRLAAALRRRVLPPRRPPFQPRTQKRRQAARTPHARRVPAFHWPLATNHWPLISQSRRSPRFSRPPRTNRWHRDTRRNRIPLATNHWPLTTYKQGRALKGRESVAQGNALRNVPLEPSRLKALHPAVGRTNHWPLTTDHFIHIMAPLQGACFFGCGLRRALPYATDSCPFRAPLPPNFPPRTFAAAPRDALTAQKTER